MNELQSVEYENVENVLLWGDDEQRLSETPRGELWFGVMLTLQGWKSADLRPVGGGGRSRL